MQKWTLLVVVAVLLASVGPLAAQDDPRFDLDAHTFPEGTTVRFPAEYELVLLENTYEVNVESSGRTVYYIDVFAPDELADLGITDVFGAIDNSFFPVQEDFVFPYDEALDIESNGVDVTFFRYVDDGISGILFGTYLPSGSVLIVDAYGAYSGGPEEGIALAMLTDAFLNNTAFVVDVENLPLVPFAPQPVENEVMKQHTFSDGTTMRIGTQYELLQEDLAEPDFVSFESRAGDNYISYFPAETVESLGFADIFAAMDYSFYPIDETLFFDYESPSVTIGDAEMFYFRYGDVGYPGILVGVELSNGAMFVIDAYGAFPDSLEEHYAMALAFDMAGQPDLLDGVAVDVQGGEKSGGLGDITVQ